MTNKKYLKGVRLERSIINYAKSKGCIGIRSAGSKGDIDCVLVNPKSKKILFIQAKNKDKKLSNKEKEKYEYLKSLLFDEFISEFAIIEDMKQMENYFNDMSFNHKKEVESK
jgi:Holliday junction resolvase